MQSANIPLLIARGSTLRESLRVMQSQFEYRPITAISPTAPVQLSVEHDLPKDWPVWVQGVQGLQELNRASNQTPLLATVLDSSHLEINTVSAVGRNASGGMLVYHPPVDLAGASAVLRVLDDNGAVLLEIAPMVNAGGWIDIELTSAETAALDWRKGTWQLDATLSNGDVVRLFTGPATVDPVGAVPSCGNWPSWVLTFGTQGPPGTGDGGGGGVAGVTSFNGRAGTVTLLAQDISNALGYQLATVARTNSYNSLSDKPVYSSVTYTGDYADLLNKPNIPGALVAYTGEYDDLSGKPFIPTTAADVGAATTSQGLLAASAVQPAALVPINEAINLRVEKVTGYGLSKNDLTDARAAKIDAMADDHFKGIYLNPAALRSAHPTAVPGDYADVDAGAGSKAVRWLWDTSDNDWVDSGSAEPVTASQVLNLYESNPDRNAFTDSFKAKLTGIATGATKNSNTDELQESVTPTNKWFTTARVLATALTGLSVATAGDVVATDSILVAIGKIQRKWNDLSTTLAGLVASIGTKVDKVDGYGLSQANYTATEKTKLAEIGPWDNYLSVQSVRPSNGSTAGTVLGIAISSGGTASHPTLDQSSLLSATRRVRFTGGTAAAVQIGVHETALTKTRGGAPGIGGFHVEITFSQATNVTGHQVFSGLAAATALLGSDPSAVANTIGMGYDSADDASGNWYLIHNDGSGAAAKDDVGIPRNTTDLLRLTLHAAANGAGIDATVRNLTTGVTVFSATVTTKLPASTAFMGMRVVGRNGSLGNVQILEVVSMEAGYQDI